MNTESKQKKASMEKQTFSQASYQDQKLTQDKHSTEQLRRLVAMDKLAKSLLRMQEEEEEEILKREMQEYLQPKEQSNQ